MANYSIFLLDSSGVRTAMLDMTVTERLKYNRQLNGIDVAQFTLPLSDARASLLTKHAMVEIERSPDPATTQNEGTYIMVYRNPFMDNDGRAMLIVSAFSLEFLLQQRHIDPRNDPLMTGGYTTKSDAVDTVMAELVYEQAGAGASTQGTTPSQKIDGLTVVTPTGVGTTTPVRLAWENLLSTLKDLASGDRMDFRIERTSGMAFSFYAEAIGNDKTRTTNYPTAPFVMLDPVFGTMVEPELVEDWRAEKTVVWLMGQGSGDDREFYGSVSSKINETPFSHAVAVEDLREAETIAEYAEQANQLLAKHAATIIFDFKAARVSDYRDLWDLGDAVSAQWSDFAEDVRIDNIEVDVSDEETIILGVRKRYA